MKKLLLSILAITAFSFAFAQVNPNYHQVKSYYKSDGTYVPAHYRTNPNNTINDNYSTYPNVNPWTGKAGSISPSYCSPTYSTPDYNTTRNYTPLYTNPILNTQPLYNIPTYTLPSLPSIDSYLLPSR